MNGALAYAVVAIHQSELRVAAERSRRVPRKPRRSLPVARRRAGRLPEVPQSKA